MKEIIFALVGFVFLTDGGWRMMSRVDLEEAKFKRNVGVATLVSGRVEVVLPKGREYADRNFAIIAVFADTTTGANTLRTQPLAVNRFVIKSTTSVNAKVFWITMPIPDSVRVGRK